MTNKNNQYWLDRHRFLALVIILFVIFMVFMTLIYLKLDEVTHHPCEICADKIGQSFVCYSLDNSYEPINFMTRNESGG